MPRLGKRIRAERTSEKAWMAGSSPAMTGEARWLTSPRPRVKRVFWFFFAKKNRFLSLGS
jgi:hypothetical protein